MSMTLHRYFQEGHSAQVKMLKVSNKSGLQSDVGPSNVQEGFVQVTPSDPSEQYSHDPLWPPCFLLLAH
jgi:hypothetical protein